MKRKILSMLLTLIFIFSLSITVLAAGGHSNFGNTNNYSNQFTDVKEEDWFFPYVKKSFEYGLMQGYSDTQFAPASNLNIAQTITLAARLHSIYTTGAPPDSTVPEGGQWYDPYVNYALSNNIITSAYSDYSAPASRSDVAVIFAKSLGDGAFNEIRTVKDGTIPDVSMAEPYAAAVYQLYRAGILSGSDSKGTYNPKSNITRSEIAAICVRIADPSQRSSAEINPAAESGAVLSAERISEKCAAAVFYIETWALNGDFAGSGSGFFISAEGHAITNYHVIANSSGLIAITYDGKIYENIKIIDSDEKNDLALIKVEGGGFTYLEMGDSSLTKQGQQVYAIGSPKGLDNTMSQGIISNAKRELSGIPFIQISVPIAHGSSGGALINDQGKVIGVTSAGFSGDGDLNLAVPINLAKSLDKNSEKNLFCPSYEYYYGYSQAVDFGAFSGVNLLFHDSTLFSDTYEYDVFDFVDADYFAETIYFYSLALKENGLVHTEVINGFEGSYESNTEYVELLIDMAKRKVITVNILREPPYYKDLPRLRDFGAFAGMKISGQYDDENGVTYQYKWTDYYHYEDIEEVLNYYFTWLIFDEYEYIAATNENDTIYYLFEGNGLSVIIAIDYLYIYIDIVTI